MDAFFIHFTLLMTKNIHNVEFQPNWDNAINDFDAMNLNENVLMGIYLNNIISPTNVQELAIQPIVGEKDTFVVAKEHTGKTVAFCIGILNSIDPELHKTQSIILLPTHGIAYRTYNTMKSHAMRLNISIELFADCYDIKEDIEKANKEPSIIIGTPGRILDLIKENKLKIESLKIICIKGFEFYLDDLKTIELIFQSIPNDSQKLFFTTLFDNKLQEFMNKFMIEPIKIKAELQPKKQNVKCYCIPYSCRTNKLDLIEYLLSTRYFGKRYIIFVNTIETIEKIWEFYNKNNCPALYIHSGFTQIQKEQALNEIEYARVLICDDSVLEYIDLEDFYFIINYDFSESLRISQRCLCLTNRLKNECIVYNIVTTPEEENHLYRLLSKFNIKRLQINQELMSNIFYRNQVK